MMSVLPSSIRARTRLYQLKSKLPTTAAHFKHCEQLPFYRSNQTPRHSLYRRVLYWELSAQGQGTWRSPVNVDAAASPLACGTSLNGYATQAPPDQLLRPLKPPIRSACHDSEVIYSEGLGLNTFPFDCSDLIIQLYSFLRLPSPSCV